MCMCMYMCVWVCVCFFLISDKKNTILFKEREKEKDKVVGPWEKRKERKKEFSLVNGPHVSNLFTKDHSTTLLM